MKDKIALAVKDGKMTQGASGLAPAGAGEGLHGQEYGW